MIHSPRAIRRLVTGLVVAGRAVMGLAATRLVSRSGERVVFPAMDPRFEFRRPSVAQEVVLSGVRSRKPLYVTPYALAGRDRTVGAGGDGFRSLATTPARSDSTCATPSPEG